MRGSHMLAALASSLALSIAGAGAGGCKDLVVPLDGGSSASAVSDDAGPSGADQTIATWDPAPKTAAQKILQEYGEPDDIGGGMLMWGPRGPWKRMVVYSQDQKHDFPAPHDDLVEQVIDARVPAARIGDIASFDGSVRVDRTAGEVSAREADEASNFAALNFAMKIASGAMTVQEARQAFADALAASARGQGPPETKGLTFAAAQGSQADPDAPLPAAQ